MGPLRAPLLAPRFGASFVVLFFASACAVGCAGASDDGSDESTATDDADSETSALETSDGYVRVPGGFQMHKSCVVELEDDDTVEDDTTVRKGNGDVVHRPPCPHPRRGNAVAADNATLSAPTVRGWVTSEWAHPAHAIGQYTGTWRVPAEPSTQGSQLVYFFNSTTDADNTQIIQPVLQWGVSPAGGGKYFAIASWNVGAGYGYHSRLVRTSPGHVIHGYAKRSQRYCGSSLCWQWDIVTKDTTSGAATKLTAAAKPQAYFQGAVLEAYGVTSCAQYPGTSITFSSTAMYNQSYARMAPSWYAETWSRTPSCHYRATANSATSLTLHY